MDFSPASLPSLLQEETLPPRPKRPLTAYNLFFQQERQNMLEEKKKMRDTTSIGFAPLARAIAAKWKVTPQDQRRRFEILAESDRLRYTEQMKIWKHLKREFDKSSTKKPGSDGSSAQSKKPKKGKVLSAGAWNIKVPETPIPEAHRENAEDMMPGHLQTSSPAVLATPVTPIREDLQLDVLPGGQDIFKASEKALNDATKSPAPEWSADLLAGPKAANGEYNVDLWEGCSPCDALDYEKAVDSGLSDTAQGDTHCSTTPSGTKIVQDDADGHAALMFTPTPAELDWLELQMGEECTKLFLDIFCGSA